MNDEFLAHSLFGRVAIPVGKPTYRYGKLTIMPFVGICSITELPAYTGQAARYFINVRE